MQRKSKRWGLVKHGQWLLIDDEPKVNQTPSIPDIASTIETVDIAEKPAEIIKISTLSLFNPVKPALPTPNNTPPPALDYSHFLKYEMIENHDSQKNDHSLPSKHHLSDNLDATYSKKYYGCYDIWDRHSGQHIMELPHWHVEGIVVLDDKRIVTANGDTMRFWNLDKTALEQKIEMKGHWLTDILVAGDNIITLNDVEKPNDRSFMTNNINIWDKQGKLLQTIPNIGYVISTCLLSNSKLACANAEGVVIWDLKKLKMDKQFSHYEWKYHLYYNSWKLLDLKNGNILAHPLYQHKRALLIFNTETGKCINQLNIFDLLKPSRYAEAREIDVMTDGNIKLTMHDKSFILRFAEMEKELTLDHSNRPSL